MTNLTLNTKLSGEYRFVITSSDGSVTDTGWSPNLILNQGLDKLGNSVSSTNPFGYCSVGTGTSTPVVTQTSLDAPVAYSGACVFVSSVNSGTPTYSTLQTFSYTFAQGSVVGNMSEVGVGSATTGGNLFSRALIVDGSGNPTTITLTSIDQLTVYYRISVYPPLVDGTGSITLGGVAYNYTTRILSAASIFNSQYLLINGGYYFSTIYNMSTYAAGAALAPITSSAPTGTSTFTSTGNVSTGSYTTGTYYKDLSFTLAPSQGNETGGIQAIKISQGGPYQSITWQIVFNTPIPKVNTNQLSMTFRFAWGR